ncbi:hypothetical protein KP79_PYT05250 [Mizuhopecten yessoensis]|uniref:Uncharacterized protein n=1 Tax=Mizuhopecten yessoensis TaxID=6573 RepID=A0A210QCP6_MIZYE|nr:hypothetical protein KP79_PYT05250 [Mizuhopecten yessoensis]
MIRTNSCGGQQATRFPDSTALSNICSEVDSEVARCHTVVSGRSLTVDAEWQMDRSLELLFSLCWLTYVLSVPILRYVICMLMIVYKIITISFKTLLLKRQKKLYI